MASVAHLNLHYLAPNTKSRPDLVFTIERADTYEVTTITKMYV